MLAGQVDLILEFLGLSGQQPGLVPHLSAFARAVRTSRPGVPQHSCSPAPGPSAALG
jgi:hypothetical protein